MVVELALQSSGDSPTNVLSVESSIVCESEAHRVSRLRPTGSSNSSIEYSGVSYHWWPRDHSECRPRHPRACALVHRRHESVVDGVESQKSVHTRARISAACLQHMPASLTSSRQCHWLDKGYPLAGLSRANSKNMERLRRRRCTLTQMTHRTKTPAHTWSSSARGFFQNHYFAQDAPIIVQGAHHAIRVPDAAEGDSFERYGRPRSPRTIAVFLDSCVA